VKTKEKKIETVKARSGGIFRLLWSVMTRGDRWHFAGLMVLCVISSVAVLIPTQLVSIIISRLVGEPMLLFGITLPTMSLELLIILAAALTYVLDWLRVAYRNRIELLLKRVVSNYRVRTYEWLISPRKNMDLKMTQGDAAYRLNEAPQAVIDAVCDFFKDILRRMIIAVIALGFICFLDILSLPIILAGVVLCLICAQIRANMERRMNVTLERAKSSVANSVVNSIANLPVINLFRTMSHEHTIFREKIKDYYAQEKRFLRLRLTYWTIVQIFEVAVTFAVIYLCAVRALNQTMIVGNIVIVVNYLDRIFTPIQDLGGFTGKWVSAGVKVDRMAAIEPAERERLPMTTVPLMDIQKVTVDNVDIQNGDIFKIKDVNLEFKKGKMTVLYGESGCGKSTIIRFVCGLCEKLSGELLVNGVPIEHPYQLTEHMSVTMQSPSIFNRDLKYNIIYPSGEAPDKDKQNEIVKNLRLERVFGRSYAEGTQQNLENTLSGGEKKRICISRGLLKPAAIYIFDEPTNDLDHENAMKVIDYIDELKKNAVVIAISHDRRMLDRADKLYKLNNRVMLIPESGESSLPVTDVDIK
jgi:ABC-type multidrug transport system fused ATPase/permease subunit